MNNLISYFASLTRKGANLRQYLILFLVLLCSCGKVIPPTQVDNACGIFSEKPKWYFDSQQASARWGISIPIILAFMHQESRFRSDAQPKRPWVLGIIPLARPSTAYGYAQALDQTWKNYQTQTGNTRSQRYDYRASADFIGWYCHQAVEKLKLKQDDVFHLYLAYHEGIGGYVRQTYLKRQGIVDIAKKVENQSHRYATQMDACQNSLPQKHWYDFN